MSKEISKARKKNDDLLNDDTNSSIILQYKELNEEMDLILEKISQRRKNK